MRYIEGIIAKIFSYIPRERREIIRLFFDLGRFTELLAEVNLGGEPFYFNIFRISKEELQFLVGRIWEYDCYLMENIRKKTPVVFDIGAHIGVFSRFVFFKNKNAKLWAFEPDKDNMHILKLNLVNHIENVEFVSKGIYFKKDKLKFYVSKKIDWRSSLYTSKEFMSMFEKGEYSSMYEIETTDFDSFVQENITRIKSVDLIKITVPGMIEHLILEKSINVIQKFRPQVSISVYNKNKDKVEMFFRELGYKKIKTRWNEYKEKNIKDGISDIWVFVP